MSKLLIEENPLVILPQLAKVIGLNEAIVLQQIHYWVDLFQKAQDQHHWQDGRWWVWNTGTEWQVNFPFWSECTVRRVLDSLRKPFTPKGKDRRSARGPLIITGNFNRKGYDQTLWYRIDYEEVDRLEAILADCVNGPGQVDEVDVSNVSKPIPETTSETNTENLPAAVASAPGDWASAEDWDITHPIEVFIYPEDMTFHCPNPHCDSEVAWASLKKSKAVCPRCGQHLSGIEYGGKTPVYKPPKVIRKKRNLGTLLPNIAESYAYLPYYANDAAKLKLMLDKHADLLYNCLQWSVGRIADSRMPEHKAVGAALSLVEKKLRAKVATNSPGVPVDEKLAKRGMSKKEAEEYKEWLKTLK